MPGTSRGRCGRELEWSEAGQMSGVRTRLWGVSGVMESWWRGEEGERVERLWGVWRSHFVVRREWEVVQDSAASAETCRGIIFTMLAVSVASVMNVSTCRNS